MDRRFIVIPLWILDPVKTEETEETVDYDPINGCRVKEDWVMEGEKIWPERCVVCDAALFDDEVDLCTKCEDKYYLE